MARTAITAVPITDTGYNLTDSADFQTLGIGADNGVEFTYQPNYLAILKNSTAGAASYTVKVPTPSQYSDKGLALSDVSVAVAAGKTVLYPLSGIFKQADGKIYIDCDVAGEALVLET